MQRKAFIAGLFDRTAPSYDSVGVEYFRAFAARLVELTAAEARERDLSWADARVGDAEAPEGASYDVVLSAFAVFFLPDPVAALRRYRALLPEGSAWGRIAREIEQHLPFGRGATARPDRGPLASPESLAETLREVGFADVTRQTEGF